MRDREVEKAHRSLLAVEAYDEDRIVVTEGEERVVGHREAALGRIAAPHARHLFQTFTQLSVELARTKRARFKACSTQAVHRLPHLADRPALEREGRRVDDGFVAVVERA